jgi:hypothetical protein
MQRFTAISHLNIAEKAVRLHATQKLGGRGGTAPTQIDSAETGVSGLRHTPAAL